MAKIIFIEDEPALQKTLGGFLRDLGYSVISALDGEAGLALIKKERPDLVLLDLVLPKKSGQEVLEEMRSDGSISSTPVIILTNVESSEAVEKAVWLGVKAYLTKTNYSLDEVLEKIKSALKEKSRIYEFKTNIRIMQICGLRFVYLYIETKFVYSRILDED